MTDTLSLVSNGSLSLAVSPIGAEMQYLRTSDGADLLWDGDAAFWTGRSPVLFPIVGRAPEDRIAVGAHEAAMKQHGFARRSRFDLVAETGTSCTYRLDANDDTRAVYPCDFALEVTHLLEGETLRIEVSVRNSGGVAMPFGFGFHPAFRWPLPGAEGRVHRVELAGGSSPDRHALKDGLLERAPRPGPFVDGGLAVAEALFRDDALVFPNGSDALRYGPEGGPSLSFKFENLPDLALWKPVGAPFLCIEPWHGTAPYEGDGPEIADRPNAITLAPRAVAEFALAVTVRM